MPKTSQTMKAKTRAKLAPRPAPAALTDQQVAAVFTTLLGWQPRLADLAVLRVLSPGDLSVEALAEYIWDHVGGEPAEPSLEQVAAAVREVVEGKQWRA
jgi:hypothetical protein